VTYPLKKLLFILAVIPLVFWGIWLSFPSASIQSIIENSLNEKFTLELQGLKKGLFYNLNVDTLLLKNKDRELFIIRDIRCRINPLPLFMLRLDASVGGNIGKGGISGMIALSRKRVQADLGFEEVDLKEVTLFKDLGIRGEGTISGMFTMSDDKGHAEFFAEDAHFETAEFSGVIVPLNLFNTAKGAFDITGNIIQVLSLSLEGRDIHARLKGIIKGTDMDLRIELMPEKSFLENPFLLVELEKYMISPGYYVVPVQGNLTFSNESHDR